MWASLLTRWLFSLPPRWRRCLELIWAALLAFALGYAINQTFGKEIDNAGTTSGVAERPHDQN